MFKHFPLYRQRDAMDCGPTCLMMIAQHYGKSYSLPHLRDTCHISREGVSALGITEGAESIGFRAMSVKVPFVNGNEASLMTAPLPCIAHWNQSHFIVIHKVTKSHISVADPAAGKFKLKRADFEKSWLSDTEQGVLILLDPSPEFYNLDSPVNTKTGSFSNLFQYLKPYKGLISQLVVGMILGSVFQLIFPFLTQSIVDIGIENQNIGFIYLILAGQVMLFLSQLIVSFVQNRILLHIGTRINVALVTDFLIKLMHLPIGYFDTKMTGDLMQRIGDQSRIESFLTQSSLSIVFSFINFIVFSIVLLLYNPMIFFVFIIAATCYIAWISIFLKKRKEIDYVRFQQASDNQNSLIELIQGMSEIKLQGSERKRRQQWAGIQAKLFNISIKSLNIGQWQDAGAAFFNQSKDIIITIIAAQAVIEGKMTLGMMMAAQYMVAQLNAPLQQFITFIRSAQDAKISMERLAEIHQQPNEDDSPSLTLPKGEGTSFGQNSQSINIFDRRSLNANSQKYTRKENTTNVNGEAENSLPFGEGWGGAAGLVLSDISFKYNALDSEVLQNINLNIPHGKVTAIVGTSGSGKTTLIKLLLGMYRPTKGNIRFGNINLSSITPSPQGVPGTVWRKECGAVMQDGFIFSDTIANNIAESDEIIDKSRLLYAVQMSNIQEFIETLPLTYNTKIGARGNGISQGQRQRLLIARAIYKNPQFLFFDEATNALDANNERVIVENLQNFYQNRTVVVVAHRLSTVKNADQIVVLEKGQIVEIGTHSELVKSQGAYFNLVKNQLELGN
jgi:ATP-binding cassette, subfamily B, bacterial